MNRRRSGSLAALMALALASHAASADPIATVRSGDHLTYGRIIIETDGPANFHVGRDGDHVTVQFDPSTTLGSAPPPPRNVHSITTAGSTIELRLIEGARVQPSRLNGKVVLDIMDPIAAPAARRQPAASVSLGKLSATPATPPPVEPAGGTAPQQHPAATPPQPGTTAAPIPVQAAPLPQPAPQPAAPAQQPTPPPAPTTAAAQLDEPVTPGRDVAPEMPEAPMALMVRRVRLPRTMEGAAVLLPFAASTGVAMFPDSDGTTIVFDERRPVDMNALRDDPVFGAITVRLLANGTLLHIPPQPGKGFSLTAVPRGWRLTVLPTAPRVQPITFAVNDGKVSLAADEPNEVVTMADPQTGATVLVGTQRRPGQGVLTPRRAAEFEVRPTLLGVVVEPISDQITLKPAATGFQLAGGSNGLFISPQTSMTSVLVDAAHLTRRFAFPTMTPESLMQLLKQQIVDASDAPPLARGTLNHRAAETMLALGMGAEAEGLLQLAAQQDPNEAGSADNAGLTAIAALLAGRVSDSEALTDHRLDGSDEIALWRAVRQAMLDEGSPVAAAAFSATAPLAIVYPQALRDQILPLIVENMVQGGEIDPAKRLLEQRNDDPRLAYARALLHQAEGDVDGALAMLDALADGHDQFDRARAAVRAVELRLAARKLNSEQAADALDKLLYVWRGDDRELKLRERVAELRGQNSQWNDALGILRQAQADFPDQADEVHTRLQQMFTAMVHDTNSQHLRPLEFVSLVDENADLLHDTDIEDGVDQKLAEDLLALDLPQRAQPVLEKLLRSAATDEAKARYGLSLATIKDRDGDPAGAIDVLDQYQAQDVPADLAEDRLLLRATAIAHKGDTTGAVALLADVHTGRATEARAQILENAEDWPAAEKAWSENVGLTVQPAGTLDESQTRTVLRLATAMAHAKDDAGMAALRQKYVSRIGTGPLGDMFRLLTAEPVQSSADLARSGKETSLAAAVPADLTALKADSASR